MEALKLIYSYMKENGKYLIDYKTFTSTLDQMIETAKGDNETHANDVFIVILEEFIPTLMKRKEARALARSYLAEEAKKEAAALQQRLGGAVLEDYALFETVTHENGAKLLEQIEKVWSQLDEMEEGDQAKTLVFYLARNASVLCVVMGEEWICSVIQLLSTAMITALSNSEDEN